MRFNWQPQAQVVFSGSCWISARQVRGQGLALRSLFVVLALGCRRCLLDLGGQGGQIGVDGFFQQAPLFGVERFAAGGEFEPLQHRHLVGELVDEGLLEGDLAILVGRLGHQGAHHIAQLLRVKVLDLCFVDHEK